MHTEFRTGSGVQGRSVWVHVVHPFKDIDLALWYMIACSEMTDLKEAYLIWPVIPYLRMEVGFYV